LISMKDYNIVALVTLYRPEEAVHDNIKLLSEQVDKVILCDNSPAENNNFADILNCIYVYNEGRNLGLSAAFNKILKSSDYVKWTDTDFIIFFDQDSKINESYVESFVSEYRNIMKVDKNIGCLGPIFFNTSNNIVEDPHIKDQVTEKSFKVNNVITSSMLATYGVLKTVNFWNENIFLDLADWELCWRLNYKGHQTYITKAVMLKHSVGEGDRKVGPFHIRVGSPVREYYQTRDSQVLVRKKYVPFKMKLVLMKTIYIRPIVHKFFMPDWDTRRKYIERGKEDYKKHIKGEYIAN